MNKKYFFFDIDGTLTDQTTHQIVPSAKTAIDLLKKQGHFVAIATGRAQYKTVKVANALKIENLVCAGGGCIVYQNKVLFNTPLDFQSVVTLLQNAKENHVGALIAYENSDAVIMQDYLFLQSCGLRKEVTTYHYDPTLDPKNLAQIYKVYLAIPSGKENQYPWMEKMSYLRMTSDYVVYQYDQKKTGILKMMEILNAPLEDVVVFGDDKNDLVMFDDRWTCIAMGNGKAELKEKATYVTEANIDDGIYKACLKFGWIVDKK